MEYRLSTEEKLYLGISTSLYSGFGKKGKYQEPKKRGIIVPIHKKGDTLQFSDNGGISSKNTEEIVCQMFERLTPYVQQPINHRSNLCLPTHGEFLGNMAFIDFKQAYGR